MRAKDVKNDCLSCAFDIVLQLPFGTTPSFSKPKAKRKCKNHASDFWQYVKRWLYKRGLTYVLIRDPRHPVDVVKHYRADSGRLPFILIGRTQDHRSQHCVVLFNGKIFDCRIEAEGIPRPCADGGTLLMFLVPRPKGKYVKFKGMYRVRKMKRI